MEPTPEQLTEAHERGFADGWHGLQLPDVHDSLIDAYANGRRLGTARSGRVQPRPETLSAYSLAVLAEPIFAAGGHRARIDNRYRLVADSDGVHSPDALPAAVAPDGSDTAGSIHERGWKDGHKGREPQESDEVYLDGYHAGLRAGGHSA